MEMKDQINNLVVANSMACYVPQGAGVKVNNHIQSSPIHRRQILVVVNCDILFFQVHSWNGSSKLLNQNKYVKCLALMQGKLYCGCHDNSIQVLCIKSNAPSLHQAYYHIYDHYEILKQNIKSSTNLVLTKQYEVLQDIDLATGTVGTIQTGSKKLIGKSHPIHALQAHDGLIYAASPSPEGTNIKVPLDHQQKG